MIPARSLNVWLLFALLLGVVIAVLGVIAWQGQQQPVVTPGRVTSPRPTPSRILPTSVDVDVSY